MSHYIISQCSQLSPYIGTVVNQADRARTTGTTPWRNYTREKKNGVMLKYYYQSRPENIDYRRRKWKLWKELGRIEISEQHMADQVKTIIKKIVYSRRTGWNQERWKGEENQNKDIVTALEGTGPRVHVFSWQETQALVIEKLLSG